MNTFNKIALGSAVGSIGVFLGFLRVGRVDTILIDPITRASELIDGAPYIDLGGLILQQPSSTLLVFLLGLVTIGVGVPYLRQAGFISRWLGINFIFWGLGAWVAGLSYQAFGAALKCTGDQPCAWTNGVELFYMILTVLSINALLVAYSGFTQGKVKDQLQRLAIVSVWGYTVLQGVGMVMPGQFLLSYEFMLIFLATNIVLMMVISYRRKSDQLHHRLWTMWLLFLGVNAAYFVALFSAYAIPLYESTGIWFNENDVLHVLLLAWMVLWVMLVKPKQFAQVR
jgi:hypothetical protein